MNKNIKQALSRGTAEDKKVVLDAITAHQIEVSYPSPAKQSIASTKKHMIDSAIYDLLSNGCFEINGMPSDVWLLRFLREYHKEKISGKSFLLNSTDAKNSSWNRYRHR